MDIIKHNPPSRGTRVLANMIQRLKFFGVVPAGPTREFHHVYDTGKMNIRNCKTLFGYLGNGLKPVRKPEILRKTKRKLKSIIQDLLKSSDRWQRN